MLRTSLLYLTLAATATVLIACSDGTVATGPEGLRIEFIAEDQGQPPCRIERIATIDQQRHSLYMVRGEGRYRLDDGRTRSIPVQIQFRGIDGIVSERVVTLTDFEERCDQVGIEWSIEYCQNQDRDRVACPPFEVIGQDDFRAFNLNMEPDSSP